MYGDVQARPANAFKCKRCTKTEINSKKKMVSLFNIYSDRRHLGASISMIFFVLQMNTFNLTHNLVHLALILFITLKCDILER